MSENKAQHLGLITAESVGVGTLEDPNWIGLEVSGEDKNAVVAIPTLRCAETASALLYSAQRQAMNIPPDQLEAALEHNLSAQLGVAIETFGALYREEEEELLLSVGFGVMRFKLDEHARAELKKALQDM